MVSKIFFGGMQGASGVTLNGGINNEVWSSREPMTKKQVDTRHNADWRELRFISIEDCIDEVKRIQSASEAGNLRTTGNWTPGEIMTHVASWIDYAYDGFPIGPPPFFIRWILRFRLSKILSDGMPRGVRIPGVKEGTLGMEDISTAKAAERLLNALARLQSQEEATFDSPAFGAMSRDDRIRLNLRHAELHLGFLCY